jgi:hypothetical protein
MPVHTARIPTDTLTAIAVRSLGGLLLASACCWGLPGTVHASPNAPAVHTYQPKPKETLDQVIEHTLAGSPLKIELLRQAFVAQNPQAFAPGKPPKLRKGVTLTVPDHDELLRVHLGARATPVADPSLPARAAPSTVEERRRWVQFP